MAVTSACAVGSFAEVTKFVPVAMTRPSFTTIAPNGPPRPDRTFSTARWIASRMKESLIPRLAPPGAQSINCTGKGDPAVYAFVMCPIGFEHGHLRLDFRKFACKIFDLVCVSAGHR